MTNRPSAPPPNDEPRREAMFRPELEIDGPGRQNRLSVAFRLLLLIPQAIVLFFLGIAADVVLVVSWFAALALGRLPDWSQRFLSAYLGYTVRVNAYAYLLVDRYPPFSFHAPTHPVRIELHSGRLNRLAVLFRIILSIPAILLNYVLGSGWGVCAFFLWLTVLITGRSPVPVFGATAAVLRYSFRSQAYFMMLTSAYPRHVFGDTDSGRTPPAAEAASPESSSGSNVAGTRWGTRPLVLTPGARTLLIVFIVLGVLSLLGNIATQASQTPQLSPPAHQLYSAATR